MKYLSTLLSLSLLAAPTLAQTYVGVGIGASDYSKYTVQDMEWDSLNLTDKKDRPTAFSLTVGERLNDYLAVELGYLNLGQRKINGTVSSGSDTASVEGKIRLQGIGLSVLANYRLGDFSPYARLGLLYGHQTRTANKSGPAHLFANPNNESSSYDVIRPIYGLGFDYHITDALALRVDHTIIHQASVDAIDNIDNGYIRRNASITTLGMLYQFGGKAVSSTPSKWSVGFAGGVSRTSARLTSGSYAGNIWDLGSQTVNAQVAGSMSDDKTDTAYRVSLFRDEGKLQYELYVATLGEFKSRSANDGITGGGNALTGATSRSANAYGLSAGYQFEVLPSVVVTPRLGLAVVSTRDEIYNSLDFAGVSGSARGPVVRKNRLTPTLGLTVGYQLSKSVQFNVGIDYFDRTGDDAALGKGDVTTLAAGVKIGL